MQFIHPRALPVILSVAFTLASLVAGAGCNKPSSAATGRSAAQAPPVPVTLQRVKVQPVQRTVEVVGTLYGEEDITVSAKVPGRIAEIFKDVGDHATPGELLTQIEKRDYELEVRQKELAIQESLAKLSLKALPGRDFDPTQLPVVRRAKLQADNARAKLDRGRKLHDSQPPLLSDQDFADMETAAAVAVSGYDVELLAAQSLLAEAFSRSADLELARQHLADTTVRVPPSRGTRLRAAVPTPIPTTAPAAADDDTYAVSSRLVAIGEYVKEGTPLFHLVDEDPVKLRAQVPERYVDDVQIGQKVRIRAEAYTDDFWGQISRINPQVDIASRNFQIEVIVPNADRRLKPGSYVKAWIHTRIDPKGIFVPRQAIQSFAGISRVYTVRDGKAAELLIEQGEARGAEVEIAKGLTGNESIVVAGINKLVNGAPVKVQ